jgi:hypothetical protein
LGFAPPSNAYLAAADLRKPELYYPLRTHVCENCWLVQTEDYSRAEDLFTQNYAYFSSTSTSWLEHAEQYFLKIKDILKLDTDSFVIEIASNDGYLLKHFVRDRIRCLGIEPTSSTATVAEINDIPVLREFFSETLGKNLSEKGQQADLIIGNNVLAHVPDINDFTRGLKAALKQGGTITLEFPHLMQLIEQTQFDTIYHEHFSYISLNTLVKIFAAAGLRVYSVEQLTTHGGSLRVYGCHAEDLRRSEGVVSAVLDLEVRSGLNRIETYKSMQLRIEGIKQELLTFLLDKKREGKIVAAYGAAAKGNTLFNYVGIKRDLIPFVFDAAESKQHLYLPGSHIPILSPNEMSSLKFDYLLVLPWNIRDEIKVNCVDKVQESTIFFTAVPCLEFI